MWQVLRLGSSYLLNFVTLSLAHIVTKIKTWIKSDILCETRYEMIPNLRPITKTYEANVYIWGNDLEDCKKQFTI